MAAEAIIDAKSKIPPGNQPELEELKNGRGATILVEIQRGFGGLLKFDRIETKQGSNDDDVYSIAAEHLVPGMS